MAISGGSDVAANATHTKDEEAQTPLTDVDDENDQLNQPLINHNDDNMTLTQKAISQTFKSTADLAKRLPTGTVLAFQVLAPIFTEVGHCTAADRVMTTCLLAALALSCFVLSFTDSFKDKATGKLRYGFATVKGMWAVDGLGPPAPEDVAGKGLTALDFVHAFTSVLVFAAVALLDKNTVGCFYPIPSKETQQVLAVLPVGIGALGSALFVICPNNRHGIGFPIIANGNS